MSTCTESCNLVSLTEQKPVKISDATSLTFLLESSTLPCSINNADTATNIIFLFGVLCPFRKNKLLVPAIYGNHDTVNACKHG